MSDPDDWTDFGLQRLFNPNNSEYLPIEEQLKLYKKRDLLQTKFYTTAAKIFGAPQSRKRVIIAPPMQKAPKRKHEKECVRREREDLDEHAKSLTSGANKSKERDESPTVAIGEASKHRLRQQQLDSMREEYQPWLQERRNQRHELEKLDNCTYDFLTNKSDKSPQEQHYYCKTYGTTERKLITVIDEDDVSIISDLSSDSSLDSFIHDKRLSRSPKSREGIRSQDGPRHPCSVGFQTPIIHQPSPESLAILAGYIHQNRIRLIELFMRVDKHKNWKVSRMNFQRCIAEAHIPMSDEALDEIMRVLDTDETGELDYRRLVYAMKQYKEEMRELVRENSSAENGNDLVNEREYSPVRSRSQSFTCLSRESSTLTPTPPFRGSMISPSRLSPTARRAHSASSARSNHDSIGDGEDTPVNSDLLFVPPPDLSEQIAMSPDDLIVKRKREKVFNKMAGLSLQKKASLRSGEPSRIDTGDSAVDDFAKYSTLNGDIALMADRYREDHVTQFREVLWRCEKRKANIKQEVLEKGLLFPGDKPLSDVQLKIRQPDRLLSRRAGRHFARHCKRITAKQQKILKKLNKGAREESGDELETKKLPEIENRDRLISV